MHTCTRPADICMLRHTGEREGESAGAVRTGRRTAREEPGPDDEPRIIVVP